MITYTNAMKTHTIIFILLMTILCSCSSNRERMVEVTSLSQIMPDSSGNVQDQNNEATFANATPDSTQKKIIKDGSITIKTNDITGSKKTIDDLHKKHNGYYEAEKLFNDDQSIEYRLKIRVPAQTFDQLISDLESGKDEIVNKNVTARDVTEEFVDTESRLLVKREYLTRYKVLLSKASTVKDILAIEEEIRKLQEEMDHSEGRLKYLNDQVTFSTLEIVLIQEKPFIYKTKQQGPFGERLKRALNGGWKLSVSLFLFFISLWPLAIVTVVVISFVRWVRNKRKA